MRKMKKINGYLVVRFNDREKRLYEGTGLGNYGVIDAELYTGRLELDRRDMKYDSVDTLEEAAELARGLEAEVDLSSEPATCTVIVETSDRFSEKKVDPESMVSRWEEELTEQIGNAHNFDTNWQTASYALLGYKAALCDLGFLPEDRCSVGPDAFGRHGIPDVQRASRKRLQSYVCDELCRYRSATDTQEELDTICAECRIGWLPDGRDALPVHEPGAVYSRKTAESPREEKIPENGLVRTDFISNCTQPPINVKDAAMTGPGITRAPDTTADKSAGTISSFCPPSVPGMCRGLCCTECWPTWLAAGEAQVEKGPPGDRTVPCGGYPLQDIQHGLIQFSSFLKEVEDFATSDSAYDRTLQLQ